MCPSGNLALVYFPHLDGRVDLETLNDKYPDMVDALANHPGVGVVMVRSSAHGPLAIGGSGVRHLDSKKVDGDDPLEQFGPYAAESLKRLDGMGNCGDLVLISMLDPDTQQVAAFEELIGSHGGLGGPQTEPVLLYPFQWELKAETLVGAPAVHDQLMTWLGMADQQPKPSTQATARETRAAARRRRGTKVKEPVAAS